MRSIMLKRFGCEVAEYQHMGHVINGAHILRELSIGRLEQWVPNSSQRGMPSAVQFGNTALEFTSEYAGGGLSNATR